MGDASETTTQGAPAAEVAEAKAASASLDGLDAAAGAPVFASAAKAARALSGTRGAAGTPIPPGRGGRAVSARNALVLQRAIGNSASARLLQRQEDEELRTTKTNPAEMIAEGWGMVAKYGWAGVSWVAAVGNWFHVQARNDGKAHAWPVTHRVLKKGVYMLHQSGDLVRKVTPKQEQMMGFPTGADEELRARWKAHGAVLLPDWMGASYMELADLGMGRPGSGPMLLLVGDPAEMKDGLGPDEIGPDPHIRGLPPLPAKIQGVISQPLGGTSSYQMDIDWSKEPGGLGEQAMSSMQKVDYEWELSKLPDDEAVIKAAVVKSLAAPPDPKVKVDPWAAWRRETGRRFEKLESAPGEYWHDLGRALGERRIGGVIANATNIGLLPVQTIATVGGAALDTWVNVTNDGKAANVAWKEEGYFLIRCTAALDPDTPRTPANRWRENSVAAIAVEVRTADRLAEQAFQKDEEEERKLKELLAAAKGAPTDDESAESNPLADMLSSRAQAQWLKTKGGIVDVIDVALREQGERIAKRKRTSPFLKANTPGLKYDLYDSVLSQMEHDRDEIQKRKDLAIKRRGWMRKDDLDRAVMRLPAYYSSSETGQTYPLLLEVSEPKLDSQTTKYSCEVQDATTTSGGWFPVTGAASGAEAIWAAADQLAGTLPPGTLSIRLPDSFVSSTRSRQFQTRLRDEKATKERLTELATILAVLALLPTGGGALGLTAAIAGAAASAISLADKINNGTLGSDPLETTMDIVNILAAMLAVSQAVLGPMQKIEKGAKFYLGRVGAMSGKVNEYGVMPGAMLMGNLQTLNDIMEANDLEQHGKITAVEASKRRSSAVANGVVLGNLGLLGEIGESQAREREQARYKQAGAAIDPPHGHIPESGQIVPGAHANAVIQSFGDWQHALKPAVEKTPANRRAANEQALSNERSRAVNEEAKKANDKWGTEKFDVGNVGVWSDIDLTMSPKEANPNYTGPRRPLGDQIRASAHAARDVNNGLRLRFGGDPTHTIDVAVHAYIGEDITPVRDTAAERQRGAAFDVDVGLAELLRASTPDEWENITRSMRESLGAGRDAGPAERATVAEAMTKLEQSIAEAKKFKEEMETQLARAQELAGPQMQGARPEDIAAAAREELLYKKRMELAELFDAVPRDWAAIERKAAEIRWFAPGAYAGGPAFQTTVRHGQARKAPERVPGSFAERAAENRSPAERQAEAFSALASHLAMLQGHMGEGTAPIKDALKYVGRQIDAIEAAGGAVHPVPDPAAPGSPEQQRRYERQRLIPDLAREFKQSRWGESDPGAIKRLTAKFGEKVGLGEYVKRGPDGEIISIEHPLPWVFADALYRWMIDELAGQGRKTMTHPDYAVRPGPGGFTSGADAAKSIRERLGTLRSGTSTESLAGSHYEDVVGALTRSRGKVNARIRELLPTVMGALRDPARYVQVLQEAVGRAIASRTDINVALLEMAKELGEVGTVPVGPDGGLQENHVFFEKYATQPIRFVDQGALGDPHGAMTHLLQDLVVDRALKDAGLKVTSPEFRALLLQAEGTAQTGLRMGDAVWRVTYDMEGNEHAINDPNYIGPVLHDLLGLQ